MLWEKVMHGTRQSDCDQQGIFRLRTESGEITGRVFGCCGVRVVPPPAFEAAIFVLNRRNLATHMRTDVGRNGHQPKGASRTGDQIFRLSQVATVSRQLDAVRGIAILIVILHNEAGKYLPAELGAHLANGWMGVDLFFVLSSFLITGILLDTEGRHFIRDFYIRRCLKNMAVVFLPPPVHVVLVPLVRPEEAIEIFGERCGPGGHICCSSRTSSCQSPKTPRGHSASRGRWASRSCSI